MNRAVLVLTLAAVMAVTVACGSAGPAMPGPAQPLAALDSAARISDGGLFRVSYTSKLEPVAINQLHSWTLHVETAAGEPVAGAQITVDGGMPEHNHGLPTQPQMTQDLGNGDYQIEGMKFQMPGRWVVTFQIDADGVQDSVTFGFVLS